MRLWRSLLLVTFIATLFLVHKMNNYATRPAYSARTGERALSSLDLDSNEIVPLMPLKTVNTQTSKQEEVNPNKNSGNIIRSEGASTSKRYLLPLYLRGGGPNWQYNNFKAATRLALYYQRTIIAMPFMGHFSNHHDVRPFQETFDTEELNKLLHVAGVEEFRDRCQGRAIAILTPSTIFPTFMEMYERHYRKSAEMLETMWNISIPAYESIPSTDEARKSEFEKTSDVDCLAIFHPINAFGLEVPDCIEYEPWVQTTHAREVELATYKFLKRADNIKELAVFVMDRICGGKDYMAIHWRNKTGERCSKPSPDPNLCGKISPMLTNITQTIMVDGISEKCSRRNLECLYIARPSYSSDIEEYMRRKIKSVYTSEDIMLIDDPRLTILKNDNYVLSLVEQEICARSKLFGATWLSSWSKFVADERQATEKDTFYFYKFPGLTEEISLYF